MKILLFIFNQILSKGNDSDQIENSKLWTSFMKVMRGKPGKAHCYADKEPSLPDGKMNEWILLCGLDSLKVSFPGSVSKTL